MQQKCTQKCIPQNALKNGQKHNESIEKTGISKVIRQIPEFIFTSETENLRNDFRYIDLLKKCKLYDFWKDDPEIKKLANQK